MTPWHARYLALARHIAGWSKDPSTQVGAVIVSPDRRQITTGYNGFPQGIADDERLHDRETKYGMVVHAELNAILNCPRRPEGCALYVWPLPPCSACSAAIIQSGIVRVVHPPLSDPRWADSCKRGAALLREAGVEVVEWTDAPR
jgi:dCMP deaminase